MEKILKYVKKFLNFIKKNLLLSILIMLLTLIIISGLIAIKALIFPNYNSTKYGNRLDNIEAVTISKDRIEEIKGQIEEQEGITYTSYRLSGKIINIYINISDNIAKSEAKKYSNEFVKKFSEEELAYYDFQVFISKNEECILIGYKNKKFDELSWNYVGEE